MDITVAGVTSVLSLLGIVFMISRGVITRSDCKECKTISGKTRVEDKADINKDFDTGRKEFVLIRKVQTDQGKQLAGVSSAVTAIADNVSKLVSHHIGGG